MYTNEIVKPEQYRILNLSLYLNDQTLPPINLLTFYREVGIYESIFEPSLSGYVMVYDVQGTIENANISGFNYIEIELAKYGENDKNAIKKTFRVYKIGERLTETNNREGYVLYFCSEEHMLSEQLKITKSFPNTPISEIVNFILKDTFKTSKIGTIEQTIGQYAFIIPNLKPFETISWISNYARPLKYPGADMLFYETTTNGFNFRSIQSIYSDNVYDSYAYSPQNIVPVRFGQGVRSILAYRYVQISDVMQGITDGMFANKLISIDPVLRSSNTVVFNYNDSNAQTPSYFSRGNNLNGNPVAVEMQNRLGKTISQTSDAVVKVLVGNSLQRFFDPIKNNPAALATIAPDIAIETFIPNRTAQIPLANAIRVQFTIPGDVGLSAGKIVVLNLPSFRYNNDKTANIDRYFAGKYMIASLKHQFNSKGEYHCIAEAITDSVSEKYLAPSGNVKGK